EKMEEATRIGKHGLHAPQIGGGIGTVIAAAAIVVSHVPHSQQPTLVRPNSWIVGKGTAVQIGPIKWRQRVATRKRRQRTGCLKRPTAAAHDCFAPKCSSTVSIGRRTSCR